MKHLILSSIAVLLVCPSAFCDEIDDLAKQIDPPARFRDHKANLRAEKRTFLFNQVSGPEKKEWWVVLDGDKYVALHRGGDFNLIALTPEFARTTLDMPTGRYHLDNQLGPTLCTHQFTTPVKMHGSIQLTDVGGVTDTWVGGGRSLTLARSFRTEAQVTEHRFVISVDPVFGYRIDGRYDVRFKFPPAETKWIGPTFCPGCHPAWPKYRLYDRTVHCPPGSGYRGWANNLLCMDRCDGDKARNAWRDGGFIAYLNPRTGWSVCRTRVDGCGDTPPLSVCNAHNDFHVYMNMPKELPKDANGWYRFQPVHRLLALPPEMTRYVWDRIDLIQKGVKDVFLYIGEPTNFDDQPRELTDPVRGLCWTSGGPSVTTEAARSGKQSLLLKGTTWPNLPEVCCDPNSRYRLEAWFKVVPMAGDEKTAARKKDEERRLGLSKAGRPLPPETDWANLKAEAYMTAHMFEWTPHSGKWLVRQETTRADGDKGDWQHAVLEFDTPRWDPKINIVLEVRNGKAYMDDFRIVRLDKAEKPVPKVYPATKDELEALKCESWPTWSSEVREIQASYDKTEVCHVIAGEVLIQHALGTVTAEAGQMLILPKGLECTWKVLKPVKKHYRYVE